MREGVGLIKMHAHVRLPKNKLKIVFKKTRTAPRCVPTVEPRPALQASSFLASLTTELDLKISICSGGCVSQFSVIIRTHQRQSISTEKISYDPQLQISGFGRLGLLFGLRRRQCIHQECIVMQNPLTSRPRSKRKEAFPPKGPTSCLKHLPRD